jgi:hypothetical protein
MASLTGCRSGASAKDLLELVAIESGQALAKIGRQGSRKQGFQDLDDPHPRGLNNYSMKFWLDQD